MTPLLWLGFLALLAALVVLDLVLLSRRPRVVRPVDALSSLGLWVLGAVAASLLIAYVYETNWLRLEEGIQETFVGPLAPGAPKPNLTGSQAWWQFFTGYVLEMALSLDNLAVLVLLFAAFGVPRPLLPRALFWSTLVSLAIRLGLITGGAGLLRHHPTSTAWVFGGILAVAMLRVLLMPDERADMHARWYVRAVRALLPVTEGFRGQSLVARTGAGRWAATPMLVAVLASGLLDVTFAADTVPALFSVTRDPFLAFSASAMGVLGLRSMYFAVAGVIGRFRYLRVSLVFVLLWVAGGMMASATRGVVVPPELTLGVVSAIMAAGVGASVLRYRLRLAAHPEEAVRPTPLEDLTEAVDATRRNLRKVLILIAGTAIIVFGVAIAPLPGPGPTVLVPIGLGLLATEFVWAKRLMDRLKSGAFSVSDRLDELVDRRGRWLLWAMVLGAGLALGALYVAGVAVGRRLFPEWSPRWWTAVVVIGSPMTPVLLWAWNYVRTRRRGERPAEGAGTAGQIEPRERKAG